ncbi:hypothetical protein [Psychrobacter immobilis]|jgi:hypothetical protein|nr:hypothetical protein [Psychrobacter immobilis]
MKYLAQHLHQSVFDSVMELYDPFLNSEVKYRSANGDVALAM